MMYYRTRNKKLSVLSVRFRELWAESFGSFSIRTFEKAVAHKDEFLKVAKELSAVSTGKQDSTYFTSLFYLVNGLLLTLEGFKNKYSGIENACLIDAGKLNIQEFLNLIKTLDQTRPSVQNLVTAASKIQDLTTSDALEQIMAELNKVAFPVILTTETHPYSRSVSKEDNEETETVEKPQQQAEDIVISVLFYMDSELWANPQIVKINRQYRLSGRLKLNKWPNGYHELKLSPVSTSDDSWFILSLPFIKTNEVNEIPIEGTIVLKYPQSLLDPPHSIKMLARFIGENKDDLYPHIIGYDQLILRVVDPRSFEYPTGYDKLNEKVIEIFTNVKAELPDVTNEELQDFIVLLSSVLNYQGYCFQYAEYKHQNNLTEDEFRDNLIKYLSANPQLASQTIKEGHLGGGRVEIRYKNIIAELKVEKHHSDRAKVIENYKNQPVVYASAASSQLSILCVLDLTEKVYPSSTAAKNVFFIAPPVHGFGTDESTSRVAVVFIDGNTKNPSNY